MKKTILIVDDEADIRNLVREILEDEGYATLTAANSKEVYEMLEKQRPDMAILDIWLQDSRHDGLQILEEIKAGSHAHIPVVMISGHGTIETAVTAIKQGAYDFIEKPFKSDRLLLMVRRGLEAASLQQENRALKQLSRSGYAVVGNSSFSKNLRERVEVLASVNSRLLISGPLGAGKTTLAQIIHQSASRANEPFLVCPCVTKGESLKEFIVNAGNGTVVLQNVCTLSETHQKNLLGLLQDKALSARIIATCKDVSNLSKALYERLAVELIEVPPLSERKSDIADMAEVLIGDICSFAGVERVSLNVDCLKALERYEWCGELHELRSVLLYAIMHHEETGDLNASALPSFVRGGDVQAANVKALPVHKPTIEDALLDLSLREAREVFEREYLTSQVERFEGNISKTAQFIGMERSALHRKIKSLQDKDDQIEALSQQAASVKT